MKITIYELLGMVKDGKAPKNIKYMGYKFEYDTNHKRYESYFDEQIWTLNDFVNVDDNLNDEVEILEEEPYIKICGSWFTKSEYDKLVKDKEEKKIPEKLKILNANDHSKEVYYENYSKEEISLDIETLQVWVNKIIDYLKSKEK